MRKWTVEVNVDGGFFERKITFELDAPSSKIALDTVRMNMLAMRFKSHEFQAHIV